MSIPLPTLNQLFAFQAKELPADQVAALESGEQVSAVRGLVLKQTKGMGWGIVHNEIFTRIGDLLDIGIPDIMAAAWNKYRILVKYLDRSQYFPDESFLVPLGEHTITSEHHPYLEILVNGQPAGKISCCINVALTLAGFILKIQDGEIREIFTGTCQGKGTVKCEGLVLLEEKSASLALPGSMKLEPGIPIES